MNELEQAITKAKAKYEAQGYSVTIERDAFLTATKGIYEAVEGYYDNGQQCYIGGYKNGKLDGERITWSRDGTSFYGSLSRDGEFVKNISGYKRHYYIHPCRCANHKDYKNCEGCYDVYHCDECAYRSRCQKCFIEHDCDEYNEEN